MPRGRCAASYFSAANQSSARRYLRERELGICQSCGLNTLAFFERFKAYPSRRPEPCIPLLPPLKDAPAFTSL